MFFSPSRRRGLTLAVSSLAFGWLTGCSGGGSTAPPPPPPPPVNSPPVFTSAGTASFVESADSNTVVYAAVATDANSDPITYSISGGADAAFFRITAAGALSPIQSLDFENPSDADKNNVYLLNIAASDGKSTTTLSLSVTVTDDGAVRIENFTLNIVNPTGLFILVPPDPARPLFYLERFRFGYLTLGTGSGGTTRNRIHTFRRIGMLSDEAGLLAIAYPPGTPNASSSPFFSMLTNENGDIEVRRHERGNFDGSVGDDGDVILLIPHRQFTNNYGGFMEFGPDGFLYIGVGDGGGAFDPNGNAQNPNSLLGKILRLDVRQDAYPADPARDYSIPAANPFAAGGGAPEVWALGFRNPVRGGFDTATGNLYIGDQGEPNRPQEINLLRPADGGANFGWPFREGTQVRAAGGPASPINPVIEYIGQGAIGGNVYRGTNRSFQNQYFFGDKEGFVWSVPLSQLAQGTTLSSPSFRLLKSPAEPDGSGLVPVRGLAIGEIIYFASGTHAYSITPR